MTAIPVADLVGDIPPETITVRTFAASTVNAYGESEATYSDTTLSAVVHPTGRRMLERLGLDRKRETISVYATSALGGPDGVRPPRVSYGGRWYEVVAHGDYGTLGGLYLVHAALLDGASA